MNRWRTIAFIVLLALGARYAAVAQVKKQAPTYDLSLEDCLTRAFRQNPDIQRSRADVEHAAGTKLVYRSRALPDLSGQVSGGLRGGSLYSPSGPYSILSGQFSQPLIDVGIPPTLRRGQLEIILAQQGLNRDVNTQLHEDDFQLAATE